MNNYIQSQKTNLFFLIGLLIFSVLNFFSAFTMELHFDEAYYWFWSQHPALGYFDHPPMISWLIFFGQLLIDHELGIRLFPLLLSSLSMIFLWKMVKIYSQDVILFWSLIYSIILIHPYSFIATPDAPLMAFTILFFYFYRRYLSFPGFQNIMLVAFALALMLYSKYHSALVIIFVLLANYRLFRKPSFWIIAIFVFIYLLPHFIWQIDHHFPTLKYHLVDSHKTAYQPGVTLDYLLNLLLLSGPWLGWLFLLILIIVKPGSEWEKALKYTGTGVFVFFFLTTFGGDFEGHWVLVGMIPLFILSYKLIVHKKKWQKWVRYSGITSFVILLTVRLLLILPFENKPKFINHFVGNKEQALTIHGKTGDIHVVFQDNWTGAAQFAWNTRNRNVACLNSAHYRSTQFDLIDHDEGLNGQTVYLITTDSTQFTEFDRMETNRSVLYIKRQENFRSYYNLSFTKPVFRFLDNQLLFQTDIKNPYEDTLRLGETFGNPVLFQLYTKRDKRWTALADYAVDSLIINPQEGIHAEGVFPLEVVREIYNDCFLMLKIGELKPIPSRFKVEKPGGRKKK